MKPRSPLLAAVRALFWLLAFLAVACSADPSTSAGDGAADLRRPDLQQPDTAPARPPLLLDVDMGLDDARVILALPQQETFRIAGIVTVEGSAGAVKGADNALRLLAALGVHSIPVAVGAKAGVKGPIAAPSWRTMAESLGGLSLKPAQRKVEQSTGQAFLAGVLGQSKQPVRVLALGPLTNLALALKADPSLAKKIHTLYLLGDFQGCTSYNCATDLEAAKQVFSYKIPTVAVGRGATDKAPFDAAFLAKVKALQKPAADLVAQMMASHSSGTMKLWDDATLACALDGKLFTLKTLSAASKEAIDMDLPGLHKLLLALWGDGA